MKITKLVAGALFGAVFLLSSFAFGQASDCPPVDVNLALAEQAQEWWMVLLDFLLQLLTPIAIAVCTTLAAIAVRKWGRKLDVDKQDAIIRMTDGILTAGISFAEEQGRKALRFDRVKTESADKLQSAVDFIKTNLDQSGLPEIAEDELVKLIESKLQRERPVLNGGDPIEVVEDDASEGEKVEDTAEADDKDTAKAKG